MWMVVVQGNSRRLNSKLAIHLFPHKREGSADECKTPIDFRCYSPQQQVVNSKTLDHAMILAARIIAVIQLRGEPVQPYPKLKFIISESPQWQPLVIQEVRPQSLITPCSWCSESSSCNHEHPLVLPQVMQR